MSVRASFLSALGFFLLSSAQIAFFCNACSLSTKLAKIEELRTANTATPNDFDFGDARRMKRKDAFDADPGGDLADGERGVHSLAATALNDGAPEYLNPLLISFNDPEVHVYGVARPEVGHERSIFLFIALVSAPMLAINQVYEVHDFLSSKRMKVSSFHIRVSSSRSGLRARVRV